MHILETDSNPNTRAWLMQVTKESYSVRITVTVDLLSNPMSDPAKQTDLNLFGITPKD